MMDIKNMAKNWYVIHVYSGFERKIAKQIKEQASAQGLDSFFEAILVPSEQVVEVKRGRKITTEQKFFPGYVLIKMDLTDDAWHLVKNTPKVTGFLGGGVKPRPISPTEADRMLRQSQDGASKQRPAIMYEIGEQVRVCDGPFSSFNGVIEDLDGEKGRIRLSVSIFGRSTPVELEFAQIEKI